MAYDKLHPMKTCELILMLAAFCCAATAADNELTPAQISEIRLRARPYLEAFDYKSFL